MKEEIIKLWKEGFTSGEISVALGLTRSAVMGHVNRAQRAGLLEKRAVERPPSVKPIKRERKVTVARKVTLPLKLKVLETPVKPVIPPPPKPKKPEASKTILELEAFDCRWMTSSDRYCGKRAKSYKTPWCEEHYKLVYTGGSSFKKRTS